MGKPVRFKTRFEMRADELDRARMAAIAARDGLNGDTEAVRVSLIEACQRRGIVVEDPSGLPPQVNGIKVVMVRKANGREVIDDKFACTE